MRKLKALLQEFAADLSAHRLRAALTTLALVWGSMAVVLLLAFGTGFRDRLLSAVTNSGNNSTRLYGGTTARTWKGFPKGRQIRFVEEDVELLRKAVPGLHSVTPEFGRYGVQLRYGRKKTSGYTIGIYPGVEIQRSMYPKYGGRFLTQKDMDEKRRVVVLGTEIVEKLFGSENPVGRSVFIEGVPFIVVGALQPKVQMGMSNGPDANRIIMPVPVFRAMFDHRYVHHIIIRPLDGSRSDEINRNVVSVLSSKYKFDPDDSNAYFMWDQAEQKRVINVIAIGLTVFLGVVGMMTLVIAGVGVANIMFIVVKERTREIGVKMAVGAKRRDIKAQFLFEALFLSLIGGGIGIFISWSLITFLQSLPESNNFGLQLLGRPEMSTFVTVSTVTILSFIALVAGYLPARKAASVDPIESLRYE